MKVTLKSLLNYLDFNKNRVFFKFKCQIISGDIYKMKLKILLLIIDSIISFVLFAIETFFIIVPHVDLSTLIGWINGFAPLILAILSWLFCLWVYEEDEESGENVLSIHAILYSSISILIFLEFIYIALITAYSGFVIYSICCMWLTKRLQG